MTRSATVETDALISYLIRSADDVLILGHQLSAWCGHAPILEEDIAMSNIALDCIGQATMLYTLACDAEGRDRTPDRLVYFRDEREFRNLLLVEQPNGDFSMTMMRQFLFDAFGVALYSRQQKSRSEALAAASVKCYKEFQYHFRHSSQWICRLGDGTEESHERAQKALTALWKYMEEPFHSDGIHSTLEQAQIVPSLQEVREAWEASVIPVFREATLTLPPKGPNIVMGGREGKHTEHLGHLLAEMQIVARSYPEIKW